jgi:hypothetical protein
MATENKILNLSAEAGEDLTGDQYRFVVLYDDSGVTKVRRPNSATEVCHGILQNAPEAGDAAAVMVLGQSKLEVNAALGAGAFVMHEYVDADDAGKGAAADANLDRARALVIEPTDAEDDLASVLLIGPVPNLAGTVGDYTVTTEDMAGDVTYTMEEILGGLILRDPNGAGRADLFPTAAAIVAGLAGAAPGKGFEFTIRNTANAAETITMTTNTGLTLSGTMTIAQNNSKRFLAVVTDAETEAVTIYSLGTVVH